jgi:hypothetical protein
MAGFSLGFPVVVQHITQSWFDESRLLVAHPVSAKVRTVASVLIGPPIFQA